MEYVDLVGRIVAAEHSAKENAGEAQKREAELESDLNQEIDKLRESQMEKARARLESVREKESAKEQTAMAALDQKLSDALSAVETSRGKYKDNWVDTLFELIVGGQV